MILLTNLLFPFRWGIPVYTQHIGIWQCPEIINPPKWMMRLHLTQYAVTNWYPNFTAIDKEWSHCYDILIKPGYPSILSSHTSQPFLIISGNFSRLTGQLFGSDIGWIDLKKMNEQPRNEMWKQPKRIQSVSIINHRWKVYIHIHILCILIER